jgi:hypothetical protein
LLAQLDQCKLDEELLVGCYAVVKVGIIAQIHGLIQELGRALLRYLCHCLSRFFIGFEQ